MPAKENRRRTRRPAFSIRLAAMSVTQKLTMEIPTEIQADRSGNRAANMELE